jgi:1-acyl-sn-glycerol-3-phosphate acyltransferase/nucleoside-diphosphate-sugar epimerase
MPKVLVVDDNAAAYDGALAQQICDRLRASEAVETADIATASDDLAARLGGPDCVLVYLPKLNAKADRIPDVAAAKQVFQVAAQTGTGQIVVVSCAAIYGTRPHNPGLITESLRRSRNVGNVIAYGWIDLEECAEAYSPEPTRLVLLRPVTVPGRGEMVFFERLFNGRFARVVAGHDPTLQFLSPADLAQAVCLAIEAQAAGIYNVAPDDVIPLRPALRLAGVGRVPLPMPDTNRDFIRYVWTVSNAKIKDEWGFEPQRSSVDALRDYLAKRKGKPIPALEESFDFFGLDKGYTDVYARTVWAFLRHIYWRVEYDGLEHVPTQGKAILAGVHRGFMPLDAVTLYMLLAKEMGRYARFLIHPTLIKFPFQFNFMRKLGGVIANQENADWVLQRDQILGVYPEGIRGAFTPISQAYEVGRFGRNEFVRMALRHGAPIVPFVNVGAAEIFPIIAKIDWGWWKRFSMWPCFPIAPPFPLLPVPLPSKWHIQFLEPIPVGQLYPPEAADDRKIVKQISDQIRDRMYDSMQTLVKRRKSVFFGSVFKGQKA